MTPAGSTPALAALSPAERAAVLDALLATHPELRAEAEALAAQPLAHAERTAVATQVEDDLQALHLSELAGRAGAQWGGGYVDPSEEADVMLAETVQTYLDDLHRRARAGAPAAALEIGLGVLGGLYACRSENHPDRVLTHAGIPDAVDDLAMQVRRALTGAQLEPPTDWLAQNCPAWTPR